MDQEEVSTRTCSARHMVAGGFTRVMVGSNRSGDYGCARTGELGSDKRDALDVLVAVLRTKSELFRQLWLVPMLPKTNK